MKISVHGLDERHQRNIEHLSALYFEEVELFWESAEKQEVHIHLTVNVEAEITVSGILYSKQGVWSMSKRTQKRVSTITLTKRN